MTIDEAIRHCEEVAWENDRKAMCVEEAYQTTEQQNCEQCAADHRQLAEWLRELKELRDLVAASNVLAVDVFAVDNLCKRLLEYNRLLKAAMSDLAEAEHCGLCKYEADDIATCQRKPANCFVWRYADEAIKLLKELSRDE